jgi:hypothetical protein
MPELTPEEMLEVESDRRRRVTAAFRLGSEASPATTGPSWIGPLAAGIAIALAIALVMGVIALAQSSTGGGASKSPAIVSTPARTPGR